MGDCADESLANAVQPDDDYATGAAGSPITPLTSLDVVHFETLLPR
jgi:hypothetical protein